jgi:hypothetical protein
MISIIRDSAIDKCRLFARIRSLLLGENRLDDNEVSSFLSSLISREETEATRFPV